MLIKNISQFALFVYNRNKSQNIRKFSNMIKITSYLSCSHSFQRKRTYSLKVPTSISHFKTVFQPKVKRCLSKIDVVDERLLNNGSSSSKHDFNFSDKENVKVANRKVQNRSVLKINPRFFVSLHKKCSKEYKEYKENRGENKKQEEEMLGQNRNILSLLKLQLEWRREEGQNDKIFGNSTAKLKLRKRLKKQNKTEFEELQPNRNLAVQAKSLQKNSKS